MDELWQDVDRGLGSVGSVRGLLPHFSRPDSQLDYIGLQSAHQELNPGIDEGLLHCRARKMLPLLGATLTLSPDPGG